MSEQTIQKMIKETIDEMLPPDDSLKFSVMQLYTLLLIM